MTASLRLRYPPGGYVGIELEVNQATVLAGGRRWASLRAALIDSLRAVVNHPPARLAKPGEP